MINLQAARELSGMTRRDVAAALGLSERSGRVTVAQIEARRDWLLSSIAAYVAAIGGTAELTITVAGETLTFPIA